jgi:hypothetical protein
MTLLTQHALDLIRFAPNELPVKGCGASEIPNPMTHKKERRWRAERGPKIIPKKSPLITGLE